MKLETLTEKELLEISPGGGNVCDGGVLGVGTAASAGYGAAFGTAFGPGVGTAVGAAVGAGIGALGVVYC
ncbi:bacteriocin [Bacillus cereus]|uniref:bacteriocin n=1 Tax=Bacillus cereus TaxID=1396 RepID=UPI0022E2AB86|nr:bacteriocin [Bacillus cereus]